MSTTKYDTTCSVADSLSLPTSSNKITYVDPKTINLYLRKVVDKESTIANENLLSVGDEDVDTGGFDKVHKVLIKTASVEVEPTTSDDDQRKLSTTDEQPMCSMEDQVIYDDDDLDQVGGEADDNNDANVDEEADAAVVLEDN